MEHYKKAIYSILICTVFLGTICRAASGSQGYALYRDGVALNLNWHGGLLVEPSTYNYGDAIVQASGFNTNTSYVAYNRFLDGNTFMGVYRPFTIMSDHQKDLVVATARTLAGRGIGYILEDQMKANSTSSKFYPQHIQSLRCDGVIEYCYEYNGIKVYGGNNWDISKNSEAEISAHKGLYNINPKRQAELYLNKLSTIRP